MFIEELVPGINLETTNVEFKGMIEEGVSPTGKNKEINWLKTLVAFANTEGGSLYVGVDNKTHQIMALDHQTADKTSLMIHRQIRNRVDPVIDYTIQPIKYPDAVPGRYVLCVSVKPNKNLPVSLHEEGLLGIYIRSFGQTNLASAEQIRELVLMSDNTPYDQPITEERYQPEQFKMMKERVQEMGNHVTEKELISIGFMNRDRQLSKGALLFADACDDIRTKVTATVWPGYSKGSNIVLASEEYTGNLLSVIQNAINFVRQKSVNGFRKETEGRKDYFSFPARSITEGIVNAVGHRNYYIQGSQIEINLFKDRLEITSPGALLGVRELIKEKNISSIIPRRRNEVICAVLEVCRYMEEKGSGFDKIEADYAGYGEEYRPYISTDATSFTLTLPDLTWKGNPDASEEGHPVVYTEEILDGKKDLRILSFCFGMPRTVREIAQEVGVKPSSYFRQSILARLAAQGFLISMREDGIQRYQSNPEKVRIRN